LDHGTFYTLGPSTFWKGLKVGISYLVRTWNSSTQRSRQRMINETTSAAGQGRVTYIKFCILKPHYVSGRNDCRPYDAAAAVRRWAEIV